MSHLKPKFNSLIILAALIAMPTLVVNSSMAVAAGTKVNFFPAKGKNAVSGASFIRSCENDGGTFSGEAPSGGSGGSLNCDKPGDKNDVNCTTHGNGNLEMCAQKRRPKKFATAGGNGGGGNGNNGGGQGGNVGGGGNPGGGRPDSAGGVGAGGSPGSFSSGNDNSGNGGIN